MEGPHFGAEALVDQAESSRTFLGLIQPRPTDKFFLVTGMTGSGKSTFVSRCTGQDAVVSHGLYSCTNSMDVFRYTSNGQRIYLIDTPGFNDTTRSDIDTLEILATYLGASYANGVRIHGIIMLYPISNNRMSGSSLRSLTLIKAICGYTSYGNLAIVTTMWPESPNSVERKSLEAREIELLTNQDYFGGLVAQSATMFRHYEQGHRDPTNQAESAKRIVNYLIGQLNVRSPDVLQLQREIVDERKTLGQTAAGIAAAEHLHKARQRHQDRLESLQTELENASKESDSEYAMQLKELKTEAEQNVQKAESDTHILTRTLSDLHQTETEAFQLRIDNLNKRFEAEVQNTEQELQSMQEAFDALQQEVARLSQQPQKQQLVARSNVKHQQAVKKARRKADKAREGQLKFQKYAGDVVNGLTNGLTASVASGGIAALMSTALCLVM
ncbi:hypothetical protein ACHAPJ_007323 [Fusarium lateritium]